MTNRLIAWLFLMFAFGTTDAQIKQVNWKRETAHANWRARDSQGELVYRDKLWILGGWFNSDEAPPRDVWNSEDGKNWQLVEASAPWLHSDLPMSIVFKDRMWMMGGWYNGRLPGHSASNAVWSSMDGIDWKLETPAAGWSPRLGAAVVEFKGKLFILGGIENYYFGDSTSLKNDVWHSEDGIHWQQATGQAGWAPRAYHQAAVLNDRIYVFGGGNYVPEHFTYNDVWSSADGIHWVPENAEAPWHGRIWFSSVVYRNHIWLLGGWSGNPYKNWSDVWYSADGKHWKEFKTEQAWRERHEHSAFVFKDKLWIAGGMVPPLTNDVWSLYLPESWPAH
jgi:Kelch motif.